MKPVIFFKKNGIASIGNGAIITNGKRLYYHSIGKQYPIKKQRHHNLLSAADKLHLDAESTGKPYFFQNQLLIKLIDDLFAHLFSREMKLNFIEGECLDEAFGCFVTKIFPPRINQIEYYIEFPYQVRPDIQFWHIANAISEVYGANKGIYGHPGNIADVRWSLPPPPLLSGTEAIQIKAYPKDHPEQPERVFRVEVRVVNPKLQPDDFGNARTLPDQVRAISSYVVSVLTNIFERCQVPKKLRSFGEIEELVLAVLKRSRHDRRILALVESLMECGSYTPSYHKAHKVPVYHLRKLVSHGVLAPISISKQRKSYVLT